MLVYCWVVTGETILEKCSLLLHYSVSYVDGPWEPREASLTVIKAKKVAHSVIS